MEEFQKFYTAHGGRLFGYLLRKSGSRHLAADLVQESFTRYLERYRQRELSLSLLFTIGRNLLYDHFRTCRQDTELTDLPAETATDQEQAYMVREQSRQVLQALQQLDEEDRDVLALVVSSGLQYREIAAIKGCTEAAVKVRVHRARQRLRHLLPVEE